MSFRGVSPWRAAFRIGLLVAGVLSGILPYFVSAASQQAATQIPVSRSYTFLLGNALFEPSDNWAAVFCNTEDRRACTATMIAITEYRRGRQYARNGQVVPVLAYTSPTGDRPGDRLFILIKGFSIKEGDISNLLAQQQWISGGGHPTQRYSGDPEPVSLALGAEAYQFRVEGLDLVIEEHGKTNAKQRVPLFIDPDKRCSQPLPIYSYASPFRRDIALEWMGDLDRDGRADFLLRANAFKGCALPISLEDPEYFLILSSRAAKGEVGMVVPAVGYRPQK